MIPLQYCRLQERETSGDNRGFQSDFEVVLMILSLDDRKQYLASEIAQGICPKQKDADQYQALNKRIYQRGYRNGLTDHLSPEDKEKGIKATWPGKEWKASLNNKEWHVAVGFFDRLKKRIEQHESIGNRNVFFYFDNELGLIESDIPFLAVVEELAQQSPWPEQSFFRTWPVVSILRQHLTDDQQALLAQYEQPIAIQPRDFQKVQSSALKNKGKSDKTKEDQANSSEQKDKSWFPRLRPCTWSLILIPNLAFILALFFFVYQPPKDEPSELDRFKQLEQMTGPPAIQGLEQILQDRESKLDKAWVIGALVEKLKDEPSEQSIKRLRELYRSDHADRAHITDIIAHMHEQVYFNPLFLDHPKRPRMVYAIDKNPMVVFDEGMLRPGDWLNFDDVTSYIKEIHPHQVVVLSNGLKEEIPFDPPVIFENKFFITGDVNVFPKPFNLVPTLEAICEVEELECHLDGVDGFIFGSFNVNDHVAIIQEILGHLAGSFDGTNLVIYPVQKPVILIQAPALKIENLSLEGLFQEFSDLSGYQFTIPETANKSDRYFVSDFNLDSLFDSLDWSYTYNHESKSVRAVKRER